MSYDPGVYRTTPGFVFPRWLTPSLLSLGLNLPLVLSGLQFYSFDAYTHLFFADHYRRWWFVLFEPRWFGGFSVASYPPLIHQLVALLSFPASAVASLLGGAPNAIRYRGEAIGYSLLLLIVLAWLPAAVRRFAAIFVPARAARAAGWLAVGLPSIYLTAYSFGQLPTLAASAALMWALAEGWQYCRTGRRRDLLSAVLWAGVTAAAHHAVLLFALTAGAAVAGRGRVGTVVRLVIWAASAAAFGAIVIWPFVVWSQSYVPQTPIDHVSRHNFFTDWLASYYFFWPMYGPVLLALPLALVSLFPRRRKPLWRKRRRWPLFGAVLLLFTLGLGGTTPLPRLLFGANWAWLTYDRFSLWAGLALLPFAGLLWELYRRQFHRGGAKDAKKEQIRNQKFGWQLHCRPPRPHASRTAARTAGAKKHKTRNLALSASLRLILLAFCIYAAFAARWVNAQPPARDLETIARFLNDPQRVTDRYLTFGFGDQLAKLSVLTDATTIDGTYFTARAIPELQHSGLGTLDGAIWNPVGVDGIAPFLDRAGEWGVRWAFTANPLYVGPLARAGWRYEGEIVPGVLVWRNPAHAVSPSSVQVALTGEDRGRVTAAWWGVVPLLSLALALLAAITNRPR